METITNEIMTNEAVAEATEDIVTVVSSDKNIAKTVVEIGVTAAITVGIAYLTHKSVITPFKAKRKAKKELKEIIGDLEENGSNAEDVESEDVDNVTDINEAR